MSEQFLQTVIIAAIAAIPPSLVAYAGLVSARRLAMEAERQRATNAVNAERKIEAVHKEVNSRLSQLIDEKGISSHAQGMAQGRADLAKEQKDEK